jgi:hypothetical protein
MENKEIDLDKIADLLYMTLDSIQKDRLIKAGICHEALKNEIVSLKAPEYTRVILLNKAENTIREYEKQNGIGSWPIQTKEKLEFDLEVYRLTHPTL